MSGCHLSFWWALKRREHQFQFCAEELETGWSDIVADAGLDISYRSKAELGEIGTRQNTDKDEGSFADALCRWLWKGKW